MDHSCEATSASTKEQQSKEVNDWLREILGERHAVELDDNGLTAMHKVMTIQKAIEKDALGRIALLQEKTKTFNAKGKLEAALSAASIAPQLLPESMRSQLKDLSHAAVLLGCQDGHTQRIEEKLLSLDQQQEEAQSKELELKTDIANFKELIRNSKNRLASVKAGAWHIRPKDEEFKMDGWEKNDQKRQARLARIERKHRERGPLPRGPARLLSLSEESEGLTLKERKLDEELQPMCELPPDMKIIMENCEAVQRIRECLTKAIDKKLENERAAHEAARKT